MRSDGIDELKRCRELFGFPENFNLIGRKLIEALRYFNIAPTPGSLIYDIASALSVQSIFMAVLAVIAGIILGFTIWGQQVYATGGNEPASREMGIPTSRIRLITFVLVGFACGLIAVLQGAWLRSASPSTGMICGQSAGSGT